MTKGRLFAATTQESLARVKLGMLGLCSALREWQQSLTLL